jgi:hypothetical protein
MFTSSNYYKLGFSIHKSKGDSEFKQQKKTSGRYTWEATHSSSQPSGIEPGQMGLPETTN